MKVRFVSYPLEASKIDGIKSLREATGITLKDAKDTVEDLQRGVPITLEVLKLEAVEVFRKFGGVALYSHTELLNKLIELAQRALEVHEFDFAADLLEVIRKRAR